MSGVLEVLTEAIRQNGERITELNNKMQAVNEGGVRNLSRETQRFVGRTMVKRDYAEFIQKVLRASRSEVLRLTDYIAYKADNEDWTAPPIPIVEERSHA